MYKNCFKIIFLSYEWHIFSIVNPEQSEMSGRNSTKPEVTSSKGPSLILQPDCYNATTWEKSHLNDKTNECLHLSIILLIFWYFFLSLFWGCIYYVGGGGEGVRLNLMIYFHSTSSRKLIVNSVAYHLFQTQNVVKNYWLNIKNLKSVYFGVY